MFSSGPFTVKAQPIFSPLATASISVAGLSPGTQGVNSLAPSLLTNPADTVAANTFWTTGSVQYLLAPTAAQFVVKSIPPSYWMRDVEVTTWTRLGIVYLRLDGNGNAVYFSHSGNSTNGTLEIGIVTGLDEGSYPGGTYYPLYQNINLNGTVPGYTNSGDTTGATFTFGVSGFDIYAKFNGAQFITFKEWRQMSAGGVALKSNGTGYRNITVTQVAPPPMYSDPGQLQLDMRDFGLRAIKTTGTISASSNSLAIATAQNFRVGDFIIVEIGAEAGAGLRGTLGVGGAWPALNYPTTAAMNADSGQANDTYAWARDTGLAWQWTGSYPAYSGGTTYNAGDRATSSGVNYQSLINGNVGNTPASSPTDWTVVSASSTWTQTFIDGGLISYYTQKSVPLSLQARISAISADGKTLTLVDPVSGSALNATVAATNANVYLDNNIFFNYLLCSAAGSYNAITPNNVALLIPGGSFAIGGTMANAGTLSGWTIAGNGQASTTVFSPKGMRGAGIVAESWPSFTVRDLTVTGNFGLNGFGLLFPTSLTPAASPGAISAGASTSGQIQVQNNVADAGATITPTFLGHAICSGINIQSGCDNSVVRNVTINDVFTNHVAFQFTINCWAYNCTSNTNSAEQTYVQWKFESANTSNGGFQDCTINGNAGIVTGYESFNATGTNFIRCHANNGTWSLNDAGGWLMQDCTTTITANSLVPAWSANAPLVDVDINTGSGQVTAGGKINNLVTVVQGYFDANNDVSIGIIVNAENPNVTITGGSYTAPNWASPSTGPGPVGILSTGANCNVSGFSSCGATNPGIPGEVNITLSNGSVTACAATGILLNGVSQIGLNGNISC